MSNHHALPTSIDPQRLAKAQREIKARVKVSDLSDLSSVLASDQDVLVVMMQFAFDENQHVIIDLSLKGDVQLQCQRCLQDFAWPVDIAARVYPVYSDEQAQSLPQDCDVFLLQEIHVAPEDILSQELSLALPLVPMHNRQDCAWVQDQAYYTALKKDADSRQHPFSGLADLQKLRRE